MLSHGCELHLDRKKGSGASGGRVLRIELRRNDRLKPQPRDVRQVAPANIFRVDVDVSVYGPRHRVLS